MDCGPLEEDNNFETNNGQHDGQFICGVIEGFYGKPWTFEQRKDLFNKLEKLKLNAFLYAPKDDTKHRADWRQLYSDQEAEKLRSLIREAQEKGIDFYYSLAPGLDITYSKKDDLNVLIRKYDQLVSLGCKSFAILFDDIEPAFANEDDKKVFKNYAEAQVAVSNMIYEHLNKVKFLFCPTEYCESRAVPNINESEYLNTIGQKLAQGIEFLWSGTRVISRLITEESIDILSKVIRRPPIIWENLHANDYDKKRVFLGPYSGRSTKIKSKIRGVMTNPNCEYEANYIAIHTLAQWCYSTDDINPNNCCNPEFNNNQSNMQIVYTSDDEMKFNSIKEHIYNPDQALLIAIRDWLPHLLETKTLPSGVEISSSERNDQLPSNQLNQEQQNHIIQTDDNTNISVDEESNVEMFPEETQFSTTSIETNKSEMDTSASPLPLTNVVNDDVETVSHNNNNNNNNANGISVDSNTCDSCDMADIISDHLANTEPTKLTNLIKQEVGNGRAQDQTKINNQLCDAINQQNIALLIDLFFLPFEHGFHGRTMLEDIKWIKDNSDFLLGLKNQRATIVDDNYESKQGEVQMEDVNEQEDEMHEERRMLVWKERVRKLNEFCSYTNRLVNDFIYTCPNKLLIIELYPYLSDARDLTTLIMDYIKFLQNRTSYEDRFYLAIDAKYKETAMMEEQEPWCRRGGIIGDVQRLLSTM